MNKPLLFITIFHLIVSAKENMTVVVSMIDPHLEYFSKSVIRPFEKEHRVDISIVNSNEIDAIDDIVSGIDDVGLFMVPFGTAWRMVDKKKILPLQRILTNQEYRVFNEEYILTWLGRKNNNQYFMPCKYETRIMVYRKSKADEAVSLWNGTGDKKTTLQDTIVSHLRSVNGIGLPRGYRLEADPEQWDYFDIFVIGSIWTSMPESKGQGKIGHRGKEYSGTALRIIDRVYQCGGDSLTMLAMDGDPVIDAFTWEATYAAFDIYNRNMIKDGWSGMDLWKKFATETIYLSFLTQVDCFTVHGTKNNTLPGKLNNPDDLGFATMPAGCSITLNADSTIKRSGSKAVTNGGWWWAIPHDAQNALRSYKLFRHITSREIQMKECTTFGMIPVRNDVLKCNHILARNDWIADIFLVSYNQVKINNNIVVPAHHSFTDLSDLYLDAWSYLIGSRKWARKNASTPDIKVITEVLEKKYTGRAYRILNR